MCASAPNSVIINDLLCYCSTARSSLTNDQIILNCTGFYKPEVIYAAKETLFKHFNEQPKQRKATANNPTAAVGNLEDILQRLDQADVKKLPRYVASSFNGMPPPSFELIAPVLCSLRDELATCISEISSLKEARRAQTNATVSLSSMAEDIADIKTSIQSISHTSLRGNTSDVEAASAGSSITGSVSSIVQRTRPTVPVDGSGNLGNNASSNVQTYSRALSHGTASVDTRARANNPLTLHSSTAASDLPSQRHQDGDGVWHTVSRNRFHRKRNERISGTRKNDSSLVGAPRVYDVYLGGLSKDADEAKINAYVSKNGVNMIKCEMLKASNDWHRSFKLSMSSADRDKLLKAEFWPEGVFVRKFYKPKGSNN